MHPNQTRKNLTRKTYQPLLGELLYLHKCVYPARILVTQMHHFFRQNHKKKKTKLIQEFFQVFDWFLQFLPHFNGTVMYKYPDPHPEDIVNVDASLPDLEGGNGTYASPIYPLHNFDPTIVHWEMLNVLVALRFWVKFRIGSHVLIYCDNA